MLSLGRLLPLTLAGHTPAETVQYAAGGARLQWLAEGALQVTPAVGLDCGLDLLLTAGVHGCEVIPIELLDRLVQAVALGEIQPRARLLLIFCNAPAMRQGVRRVAHDLNRLFCGSHGQGGSDEQRRAAELESLVAQFFDDPERRRWHYDLHSAMRASRLPQFAVCPWVDGQAVSPQSLRRLEQAAVDAVLIQEKASSTFTAHTATRHSAEAFTLEMAEAPGGVWPDCLEIFLQAARAWIEGGEPVAVTQPAKPLLKFRLAREIIKHSEAFVLRLPDDIENFAPLPPGMLLAADREGLQWFAHEPQARILFPQAGVAIGERAGLIVVPRD
jgi:succinylglutamate desuccinylase